MQEATFAESLRALLVDGIDLEEAFEDSGIARVDTFDEAGVMTMNKGLVIGLDDGTEFQITIVRSR